MSVPLPTIKWLVQNGRSIIFRNATIDRTPPTDLLTIRVEVYAEGNKGKLTLLYRSQVVNQTLNPTWTFSGMTATEDAASKDEDSKFILKAIHQDEVSNADTIILTEEIDLSRLVPVSSNAFNGQATLPLNFIVFNIEDDLFTTERQHNIYFCRPNTKYTGPYFILEKEDDPESEGDGPDSAKANTGALVKVTEKLKEMRKQVVSSMEKTPLIKLTTENQNKRSELEKLRAQLEEEELLLEAERAAFAEEQNLYASTLEIPFAMEACKRLAEARKESDKILNNKKLDLLKVKFLLEARKIKLLSELQTIYPIERIENGEYAIRGIELPIDVNARDDEQVAAALGYLVHLILLASKYLEIPLRYQLLFMGSRSFIRDPVVGSGTTLPLFRRNVEKDRFDRAVLWLRRAIEQLLLARGVGYEANQGILYNVQSLFYCEMCPRLAI